MPAPAAADISVAEHLRRIPRSVAPIARATRRMVKSIAPKAKEVAYRLGARASGRTMWKIARYTVDDANVVGFGTFANHASIFFYRGSELEDPNRLLDGSGKDSRYVRLRTAADAASPAVKRLVKQAFALARRP